MRTCASERARARAVILFVTECARAQCTKGHSEMYVLFLDAWRICHTSVTMYVCVCVCLTAMCAMCLICPQPHRTKCGSLITCMCVRACVCGGAVGRRRVSSVAALHCMSLAGPSVPPPNAIFHLGFVISLFRLACVRPKCVRINSGDPGYRQRSDVQIVCRVR